MGPRWTRHVAGTARFLRPMTTAEQTSQSVARTARCAARVRWRRGRRGGQDHVTLVQPTARTSFDGGRGGRSDMSLAQRPMRPASDAGDEQRSRTHTSVPSVHAPQHEGTKEGEG